MNFVKTLRNDKRLLLLFKAFRVLQTQGWKSLFQKLKNSFFLHKSVKKTQHQFNFKSIQINEPNIKDISQQITSKITLILYAKNYEEYIDFLVRKIQQQKGVHNTEIILANLGLQEDNFKSDILKNITILSPQLLKDKASHTSEASIGGEYIVFIPSMSYPIGDFWLYDLIVPLMNKDISAVTTVQIPSSNADFFNRWFYWYQKQQLAFVNDSVINKTHFHSLLKPDERDKTILTTLLNGYISIKKDLFFKYYSQDDSLNRCNVKLKLIKDGHNILFQMTNGLIKSCNKTPFYYLKKSYINRSTLIKDLELPITDSPLKVLLESLSFLYLTLKNNIDILTENINHPTLSINNYLEEINSKFQESNYTLSVQGDSRLDIFFSNFIPINHYDITKKSLEMFVQFLLSFNEYLFNIGYYPINQKDLIHSIFSIFGYTSGIFLAENSSQEIVNFTRNIFE